MQLSRIVARFHQMRFLVVGSEVFCGYHWCGALREAKEEEEEEEDGDLR